ncbi:MAG: right-handed parallel beta-helix repeat-containing protein [Candidatus Sumerlaeia bacterium]|nr:right-handed parallel beta-helix repeat-containing protein [Candidatus Sumerlaeia bacterium]
MRAVRSLAVAFAALAAAVPASDGPLNPPAAPASTPGPEPRFALTGSLPLVISQPGSYYLTRDRTGVAGITGITIEADDVTLDLNGFTLRGVPGSLSGILISGPRRNVAVRNGTVRDWGNEAIIAFASTNCQFEDLRLYQNAAGGLFCGASSTVRRVTARTNGVVGISTSDGCTVLECTVGSNSLGGFAIGQGSVVTDCAALTNQGPGFALGPRCVVTACSSSGNTGSGFSVSDESLVTGCSASGNSLDGFEVTFSDNRIDGNTATANVGLGFDISGTGNLIVRNSASGNLLGAFNFNDPNNVHGVLVTGIVTITAENPWANFAF